MDILLTFTGFHDPYTVGLVGQEEQPGPILSLVGVRSFDRVILFSTPNAAKHTSDTRDALRSLYPTIEVEVRDFLLDDPTNYVAILKGLRAHLRDICESSPQAQCFIAVASGTPQRNQRNDFAYDGSDRSRSSRANHHQGGGTPVCPAFIIFSQSL
jgi:hypothetical protein